MLNPTPAKVDALGITLAGTWLAYQDVINAFLAHAGMGTIVIVGLLRAALMWQKYKRRSKDDWDGHD